MTGHSNHGPCVCVQSAREKSGYERTEQLESPEGDVCVDAHTDIGRTLRSELSSVVLYFTSKRVSIVDKSTSTLLVQRGGGYARS